MRSATLAATLTRPAQAGYARAFNDAFEDVFSLPATDTTELLLIRHAKPDYDAASLNGDPFDLPLSKCGRWQAMRLATRLRNSNISAVYTSTMRQTLETASVVAAARDLPMLRMRELRDISVDLSSRNGSLPDPQRFSSDIVVRYLNNPRWNALPICEPSRRFRHRVVQALESIAAENQGQRVAVVTHGSVINAYLSYVWGIARDMFFMPAYTSISAVQASDRYAVQMLNDASHLSPGVASI